MFSTFGGGNQVIIVDGFGTCGDFVGYGTGIPGSQGVAPTIRGIGCASTNQSIQFEIGRGLATRSGR